MSRFSAERRAEVFARFARELGTLIDSSAGTPEQDSPWVDWARRAEREMLAEVVRIRRGLS